MSSACIKNKECLNALDQEFFVFASPFDLCADFGDNSSSCFASTSDFCNDGLLSNADVDQVSFGDVGEVDVDVDVDFDGASEVEVEA